MTRQEALENLREAIQIAEDYGMVWSDDSGKVTGAVDSEHGFILVEK